MKSIKSPMILFFLISAIIGTANCSTEEGGEAPDVVWFSTVTDQGSLTAFNETLEYKFTSLKNPTKEEKSAIVHDIKSSDGKQGPATMQYPNIKERLKKGSLTADQVAKLKALFSSKNVQHYTQQGDGKDDCQTETAVIFSWHIGTQLYFKCWEKAEDIKDQQTIDMVTYIHDLQQTINEGN